ncbi:MAG: hypothetical protein M3R00_00605, partial [Pseudomonadota bacterium]|nr:hypothetical protein [Pseudomonadota bacterium]
LYYVLFDKDKQQATLMETIKFVSNKIAEKRPLVKNNEKSWNAVNRFAKKYMEREDKLKHPDACANMLTQEDLNNASSDDLSDEVFTLNRF